MSVRRITCQDVHANNNFRTIVGIGLNLHGNQVLNRAFVDLFEGLHAFTSGLEEKGASWREQPVPDHIAKAHKRAGDEFSRHASRTLGSIGFDNYVASTSSPYSVYIQQP